MRVLLLSLAGATIGCGNRLPEPVPAAGIVMLDGTPLTTGTIRMVPAQGRAATGMIGNDGRFTLTTYEPNDGVLPGTHAVEVIAQNISPSEFEVAEPDTGWLAPRRYASLATSGLTVTVTEPTDLLLIELTSTQSVQRPR